MSGYPAIRPKRSCAGRHGAHAGEQGTIKGISSIKTWSQAIARNQHFDNLRREKVRFEKERLIHQPEKHEHNPELKDRLIKACKKLGVREQEVFLCECNGEKPQHIAKNFHISIKTVYRVLKKVKKQLLEDVFENSSITEGRE